MSETRTLAAILVADFLRHWRFPDIPRADRNGAVAQIAAVPVLVGNGSNRTEAVSKLRKIFRPVARSEDFHNFFVSGRSQGSKKRTK
jgi:hypothetical protein